jgi:hypothetical protein
MAHLSSPFIERKKMKIIIIKENSEFDIIKKAKEEVEKVKKTPKLRRARAKVKNFVRKHL